jgi:hypothetical protein
MALGGRERKVRVELQTTSNMLRLLLAASFVVAAGGCPFANFALDHSDCILHHPAEMCEKLKKLDSPSVWDEIRIRRNNPLTSARKLFQLPGFPPLPFPDISLKNNGISTAGLLYKIYQSYE